MGDFFHGWKRKIGVLTLLLACAFTVVWVRWHYVEKIFGGGNLIEAGSGRGRAYHEFVLSGTGITWYRNATDFGDFIWTPGWQFFHFDGKPFDPIDRILDPYLDPRIVDFRWQRLGFDYGKAHVKYFPTHQTSWLLFPYWSIILPLTVLSAWLMISKPRARSTITKPPDAIPKATL